MIFPILVIISSAISKIYSGEIGLDIPQTGPTKLIWLSDVNAGNKISFLYWSVINRKWQTSSINLWHGRRDNNAIDIAVLDVYSVGTQTQAPHVIAFLMNNPHQNFCLTFRWNNILEEFESLGVI